MNRRYHSRRATTEQPSSHDVIVADLCHLPTEILSASILSSFCDGKSLSTFFMVACGCRHDGGGFNAPSLIRHTLLHRYQTLRQRLIEASSGDGDFSSDDTTTATAVEITDVLAVICQDIDATYIEAEDGYIFHDPDEVHGRDYPEWCAILDYFEKQLAAATEQPEFVLWSGPVETAPYGVLQHAYIESRHWTATAMEVWYRNFELYQFALAIPPNTPTALATATTRRYGILGTAASQDDDDNDDRRILKSVRHMLNSEFDELGRYSLVPRHMSYEANPSLCFTKTEDRPTLNCYWNSDDDGDIDWEDGIERLGENVIRIMNRLGDSFPVPHETLVMLLTKTT